MKTVRFHTVIGEDRVIRPPQGVEISPGQAEVIVLQLETPAKPDGRPAPAPQEHLFDRLAKLAAELGIDPHDFPEDLAENHDHYAHGAPKGIDKQ